MRQLFLSWEGGGFRVTARKHFLMVPFSMLDFTSDFLRLKTRAKSRFWLKNRLPVRVFEGKKSSIESSIVTRLQENVFRARKNSPPSKSNFKSNISGQKTWTKCWNSAKSNFASNISGLKSWTMS